VPPYQPGMCARVDARGTTLGYAGALHPTVATAFDLADRRILCAELDLETMIAMAERTFQAEKVPRFPSIEFDVSAAVDKGIAAAELCRVAREVGGEHLKEVTVFDVYVGPQVGPDRKAVGLRGTLLADDRTLTMTEGRAIRDRIADALKARFAAVIRE